MTVLEDIKELGRKTAASNRELVRTVTLEKLERAKVQLRDSLLDASGPAIALYKVTELMTREISPESATGMWEMARGRFREMLKEWTNVPKFDDPTIDVIVEHLCKVYDDLAAKADSEYRANAKRLKEALEETRSGERLKLTAVFESCEEGGYHAFIPEIKGVHTQGETIKEATENLVDALGLFLLDELEDKLAGVTPTDRIEVELTFSQSETTRA